MDARMIMYAGKKILETRSRFDLVEYKLNNQTICGIFQASVECSPILGALKILLTLIWRLLAVKAHCHNTNLVEKSGHKRMSYEFSNAGDKDVFIDCISAQN